MSNFDLAQLEKLIEELESKEGAARDEFLVDLIARSPELYGEMLKLSDPTAVTYLEGMSDKLSTAFGGTESLEGTSINQYRIESTIGEGGMGVVYRGIDTDLDRYVALKFLPTRLSKNDEVRERFRREARAAARLDHTNICSIYEIGETVDGRPFIAMALYDGQTVRELLSEGTVPHDDVRSIVMQTAKGLQAAHEQGLVHRDIKPENLFLTSKGVVKILDFGIAHVGDEQAITNAGRVLGTISYMSPEQARGEAVDKRSDLWSLGVVTYELLAGRAPFSADYAQATLHMILNEDPPALPTNIPDDLAHLVQNCLQKDRNKRYRTVTDLEDATFTGPRSTRRRGMLYGRLLAGIVLAAAVFFAWWMGFRTSPIMYILPFENHTGSSQYDNLLAGMTEDIIEVLGPIPDRQVRRGSLSNQKVRAWVVAYGGFDFLGGSLIIKDNEPILTIFLSDSQFKTEDDWHGDYRFDTTATMRVRNQLVQGVLDELSIDHQVASSEETKNSEAYNSYLRGLDFMRRRTPEDLERARTHLNRAINLDASYARAYAALSENEALSAGTGYTSGTASGSFTLAGYYARYALRLDSTISQAHAALALVYHEHEWNWESAREEFELAVQYNPDNANAHHLYASHLAELGHLTEARDRQFLATLLSPVEAVYSANYAQMLYLNRQFEDTLGYLDQKSDILSDFYIANIWRGYSLIALGRYSEADAAVANARSQVGDQAVLRSMRGILFALRGLDEEAHAVIDQMTSLDHPAPLIASIYLALADTSAALNLLERGLDEKDVYMTVLKVWPGAEPLKGNRRFENILERMGLK